MKRSGAIAMTGTYEARDTKFTTIMDFEAGYNTFDPVKRTGSRCTAILWLGIRGPAGAVMLNIFTGWHHSSDPMDNPKSIFASVDSMKGKGGAVTWHMRRKKHEYTHRSDQPCGWLDGKRHCYGDVCYLIADDVFDTLRDKGLKAFYDHLIQLYFDYTEETP